MKFLFMERAFKICAMLKLYDFEPSAKYVYFCSFNRSCEHAQLKLINESTLHNRKKYYFVMNLRTTV